LPGIGPYTARAVAVFAFEQSQAVVDTNIARILARVSRKTLKRAQAQRLADEWAAGHDPWMWNQAFLDVGATICRARNPSCDRCPFSTVCRWRASDLRPPDPALGSASVSGRQSRFEGSDRQGRGRLVRALREGPVSVDDVAAVMGWAGDAPRARQVAGTLVADGLTELVEGSYRLPS